MNRCFAPLLGVGLLMFASVIRADELPQAAPQSTDLSPTAKAHASYVIGVQVGRDLAGKGLEAQLLDAQQFVQGVLDSLDDKEPSISEEQWVAAMQALDAAVNARRSVAAEKNKKEGEAFLAANQQKPGVKTLPSGLQYKVVKSGTGPSPKLDDRVRTHYEGRLIDGTVFDSSIKRGEPAVFPVAGVIRGWVEALQLMKVGDKWELYVPASLAYGKQGAGGDIGPDSVLIFDIELLGIEQ